MTQAKAANGESCFWLSRRIEVAAAVTAAAAATACAAAAAAVDVCFLRGRRTRCQLN